MWISILFYTLCLNLCKISILILFLHIFVQRWTRVAAYVVLSIVLLSSVWNFYVIFSACSPIQAYWDPSVQGASCHEQAYWLSNSGLLISTDFLVFFLPIPVVLRLKMRTAQKVLVLALFSMGFLYVSKQSPSQLCLPSAVTHRRKPTGPSNHHPSANIQSPGSVCIVSIIRIAVLQPVLLNAGPDATYAQAPILYWTGVEMNGAVGVAGCITLRPLAARLLPRRLLLTPRSRRRPTEPGAGAVGGGPGHGPHKTLVTVGSADSGGPLDRSGSFQSDAIHVENRFSAEVNSDGDWELGDLQRQYRVPFPERVKL